MNNKEWESLKKYLPCDWEEKAKELGALIRRREIKSADELLALNLLHVTDGGSYQATSEMMKLTAGISLDKNAVYKRIKSSWKWLKYLSREVCQSKGMMIPRPNFLGDRHVLLTDGSEISLVGSKTSDYRLHYDFDLFDFQCRNIEITATKEGEKLSRHEIKSNDIVIADRIYCTIKGIEHVVASEAGYVLRFKSKAFSLYDKEGKKLELLPLFRSLKALKNTDVHCFYKLAGELRPIRIVAMKKDNQAAEKAKGKMIKKAIRKNEKVATDETMEFNEYIVLATNLDYTNKQILELYRARWQIEQVFFRLKSMFGFGEIPNKNPDSVMAWFYAKLLLASLCEAVVRTECFSPSEQQLLFGSD